MVFLAAIIAPSGDTIKTAIYLGIALGFAVAYDWL